MTLQEFQRMKLLRLWRRRGSWLTELQYGELIGLEEDYRELSGAQFAMLWAEQEKQNEKQSKFLASVNSGGCGSACNDEGLEDRASVR
jgi:hypothetical protein